MPDKLRRIALEIESVNRKTKLYLKIATGITILNVFIIIYDLVR